MFAPKFHISELETHWVEPNRVENPMGRASMATSTKKMKTIKRDKERTKKRQDKTISRGISEGILLALASAFAYFFTFAYEKSYAAYFGIPNELIIVSLNTTLLFFTAIIGFFGFLFILLELLTSLFGRLNPIVLQALFPIVSALLFALAQMYFYGFNHWERWIGVFVIILILGAVTFILPLFTQKGTGNYLDKLAAQQEHEERRISFSGIILRLNGISPLILLLLFVFGYFLAVTAGNAEAVKRIDFLVTGSNSEIVVLRIYGDTAIGAPFNRSTKKLDDKFTFISIKQDSLSMFELESVGPLTRPDKGQTNSINLVILTPSPIAPSVNQTATSTP